MTHIVGKMHFFGDRNYNKKINDLLNVVAKQSISTSISATISLKIAENPRTSF